MLTALPCQSYPPTETREIEDAMRWWASDEEVAACAGAIAVTGESVGSDNLFQGVEPQLARAFFRRVDQLADDQSFATMAWVRVPDSLPVLSSVQVHGQDIKTLAIRAGALLLPAPTLADIAVDTVSSVAEATVLGKGFGDGGVATPKALEFIGHVANRMALTDVERFEPLCKSHPNASPYVADFEPANGSKRLADPLATVIYAYNALSSEDAAAMSRAVDTATALLEGKGLLAASIGASLAYRGPEQAFGMDWPAGVEESFQLDIFSRHVYRAGSAHSRSSVAMAMEAVADRLKQSPAQTGPKAEQTIGRLETLAYLVKNKEAPPAEAKTGTHALRQQIELVFRMLREGQMGQSDPRLNAPFRVAQALIALGRDRDGFAEALGLLNDQLVEDVIRATAVQPGMLLDLMRAAHEAGDADACKRLGFVASEHHLRFPSNDLLLVSNMLLARHLHLIGSTAAQVFR